MQRLPRLGLSPDRPIGRRLSWLCEAGGFGGSENAQLEHFRLAFARVHVSPDAAEHPPLDGEQSGRQGLERKTAFHVTPRAPGAEG